MAISFSKKKIKQLARRYGLAIAQVEDLYLRTLDDYILLERACGLLASGEYEEDVYLFIVKERK